MKKYVFLTQSISGITGNQRYVNNKCKFLRENGWEVIVLWNYNISSVQLEYVKCFDTKEYIHHELKFYPSWFTEKQRNKVVNRLASIVGQADQVVIESNKLELGAWGEMLARKLNAKHINFVTTEKIKIYNKDTFDFCYSKLKRNEFFCINAAMAKQMFSNFVELERPEDYYWSATPGVEVEEYSFPDFDGLPQADFTITSFGRTKGYFPYMLEELNSFISQHSDKSFNICFLGGLSDIDEIRRMLAIDNVHLVIHPKEVEKIPLQLFTKSDVVIATAGCANIAARFGGKVISMDVNRRMPLGLLRYTTLDSNTYSGQYENKWSLSEWLQVLLIDKTVFTLMKDTRVSHSFDYQMLFIDNNDGFYADSSKMKERMTKHDGIYGFLIKIGLFHLVEFFYFRKRGVKMIWR